MKYPELHTEELRELMDFAQAEGRLWRRTLERESWWRGLPCRDGKGRTYPLLYGLRNSHGPAWLANFRFPKQP